MKTIWKYPINIQDKIELEMPLGAKIITIQEQFNEPMMWAVVDTEQPKEKRCFEMFGTGKEMPYLNDDKYHRHYVNTFQVDNGNYVFHLFELVVVHQSYLTYP